MPLHLQNAYKGLGFKHGDFPVSERVSSEIVSLPMFPNLCSDQQERVVNEVMNFLGISSSVEREVVAVRCWP